MEDNTARDIDRIRLRLIDLVKSFFLEEPDAEKMSRWRGIFVALSKEQISTGLDNAVTELGALLDSRPLAEIQEEYYVLFANPFSDHPVNMSASFYIDGRSYGQTLADFRGVLREAGVSKLSEVNDAEDTLAVMLDCLASLIQHDDEGSQSENYQAVLVNTYLAPLADNLIGALKKNEAALFYEACGRFLQGYVDLEKGLFEVV